MRKLQNQWGDRNVQCDKMPSDLKWFLWASVVGMIGLFAMLTYGVPYAVGV